MDKYLNEADGRRYRELLLMGACSSFVETEECRELGALMDKSIAKQIEIFGEPKHTPFEGKCRRCGREFTNPVPEVTIPTGNKEIACREWCPDCNCLTMSIVYRESTAYRKERLYDPLKGGK